MSNNNNGLFMFDNGQPCMRDCPNRCVGCHSVCRKYIEWKKEHIKKSRERFVKDYIESLVKEKTGGRARSMKLSKR